MTILGLSAEVVTLLGVHIEMCQFSVPSLVNTPLRLESTVVLGNTAHLCSNHMYENWRSAHGLVRLMLVSVT